MSTSIVILVLLTTCPLISAITATCEQWIPIGELKAQAQPGDKIIIRQNEESIPHSVLYVGNGQVVYGVNEANSKQKMRLGNMIDLVGQNGQGCESNSLSAKVNLLPDPDSKAILKRGLSQVGKSIEVTPDSHTPEETLANYARYGNHDRSWIEAAFNQSSVALTGQIEGISLQLNKQINKSFGAFTKLLADKAIDALKWSSASAGELAGKAGASSAAKSVEIGSSFQIGKK
ncbi:hypothetical protein Ddc_24255 [Ditylenchus destructor]|nr:hypothetical protein Ddc_24255 [Ditylenchus destructor]